MIFFTRTASQVRVFKDKGRVCVVFVYRVVWELTQLLLERFAPIQRNYRPTAQFTPTWKCNWSCSLPFIFHPTDSSLHRLMFGLPLTPDNIDSLAKLLNPQNLSYFFLSLSFLCAAPSFLSSIPLFLLPVQPFCCFPPLPAILEVLVLGEFLRGIFPAF